MRSLRNCASSRAKSSCTMLLRAPIQPAHLPHRRLTPRWNHERQQLTYDIAAHDKAHDGSTIAAAAFVAGRRACASSSPAVGPGLLNDAAVELGAPHAAGVLSPAAVANAFVDRRATRCHGYAA